MIEWRRFCDQAVLVMFEILWTVLICPQSLLGSGSVKKRRCGRYKEFPTDLVREIDIDPKQHRVFIRSRN
jgi:hypothetical protein